ncbi:uncharacterized protein [Palaemon carinicauda]|uniref:uncharacterized protein n=1 Tax=Palaemon carinicauda TaxID=392227 RepID=UPI0035B669CE
MLQKANAWKSICEEVVENYSEIEDDRARNDVAKQLQVKWRILRDAFRRNHKAIKNAPSGSAANKRSYLYAPQMLFLLKTLDAAETTSNIPGCHVDNQGDLEVQPSPKIERRSKKPKSVDMQIIDYLNKQDESASDDIELCFRSLHSSVKDFTEDEKFELKARVISVISDIRKSRSNYPHNNVSQISGAATYYPYNVANKTAPQYR